MGSKLKIAFVGIRRASSFVRAFQNHPETEIVALCDLYQPTLEDAGKALGINQLYTVYEQMLD
jgi:predicted dehydrogenase